MRRAKQILQNFKRPFTPQTRLRSASNFVKTLFRRFPTFHFSTPNFFFRMCFSVFFQSRNYRKIENCLFWRSWEFLDTTGVSAMKNDPQWKDFQVSTTFGGGVKGDISIFFSTFDQTKIAKMWNLFLVTSREKNRNVTFYPSAKRRRDLKIFSLGVMFHGRYACGV